jgi:hypothetical protein
MNNSRKFLYILVRFIYTADYLIVAGSWTKYSIPYPALGFEIHYTVNEELRLYSEMKAKDIWDK